MVVAFCNGHYNYNQHPIGNNFLWRDLNERAKERHFWIFVLTGMFLIITTTGFARMAYGIILPFMQEGLHLSTAQSGMLGTILFLGYLLTVGTSGILTIRLEQNQFY